ncbi:hypothetical protein SLEP1_g16067 [Rubroshorea leprosula]|uniref:Uncharacterized protein n=1 Tax=Rubroshorea leprosula TaxID=152421 RepID=A0AAV5IVH6_9ROSI|nr:hypothetical protein SLEP1_g16067 [Rubroshorea leprosula]
MFVNLDPGFVANLGESSHSQDAHHDERNNFCGLIFACAPPAADALACSAREPYSALDPLTPFTSAIIPPAHQQSCLRMPGLALPYPLPRLRPYPCCLCPYYCTEPVPPALYAQSHALASCML